LQHEEYLDLVSVGNLAILERLEKALTVDNPVAYLYGVAKLAIRSYCYTHSQLMTQVRGKPYVWVDSLDAPLCNRQGCLAEFLVAPETAQSDFSSLYAAINALAPKQRYVIMRVYGFDGDAPESIASISRCQLLISLSYFLQHSLDVMLRKWLSSVRITSSPHWPMTLGACGASRLSFWPNQRGEVRASRLARRYGPPEAR
jgi:hypothetical protein